MRKIISALLALSLVLASGVVLADALEAGSLAIERISIRGNASWTPESLPEIWVTPYFDEYIVEGNERYPANFLCITPPENTHPMDFRYDSVSFVDHDTLVVYSYYAYDRASFELFLEKAEEEHTIADGSDGVAMFVSPGSRRARAMIDISDNFDKTSKLEIVLNGYSRDTTDAQMAEMIQAETERVMADMRFEALEGYWSDGVFTTVGLHESSKAVGAQVDVTGIIVTSVDEEELEGFLPVDDAFVEVSVTVDTYAYVESKEDTVEMTLADGFAWKTYNSDYNGYASRVILEGDQYSTVYLTIEISCEPDGFQALLDEICTRITVTLD